MAINDFVPEIWNAELLEALRNELVYAQPGIINRDYEGSIAQAGDTVHITQVADPTVAPYTPHSTSITYAALSDDDRALVVNQSDHFAFAVEDIEARQSLPGFVEKAAAGAAYGIAESIDSYVADTMYAAVNGGGNDLGHLVADISNNDAYAIFVQLRTKLNRSKVPANGRFVVVSPEITACLLQDSRFISAQNSADGGNALRNGVVGRIAGFDVIESNTTPDPTPSTYAVIAGHPIATTYANQISKVEAIRLQDSFGDGVRGLSLYGAKVVRPTALALASVTVQA